MTDSETFEMHRGALLALAYRMLGDLARAEDMVQEAWVRWQRSDATVNSPKGFLLTTVTRLCLDELGSARARHEEARSNRLPEPIDLDEAGIGRVDLLDQVSMAFLVLLQRLTPAERAVLLLHDVFDLQHREIGALLGKNDAACRQLLKRARENVAAERRVFRTSRDEHQRLMSAFVAAITSGDEAALLDVLAEDAVLVVDGGTDVGRQERVRRISRPVAGRRKIVALICALRRQDASARFQVVQRTLNGEPAIISLLDGRPMSATLIAVADGKIRHVYFQADPERLRRLGALH